MLNNENPQYPYIIDSFLWGKSYIHITKVIWSDILKFLLRIFFKMVQINLHNCQSKHILLTLIPTFMNKNTLLM
jgi:hypothetical protein